VFQNPPRSSRTVSLLIPLMVFGIVLLLVEIAGRRLAVWDWLANAVWGADRSPELATAGDSVSVGGVAVAAAARSNWLTRAKSAFGDRSQRAPRTTAANSLAASSTVDPSASSSSPAAGSTMNEPPAGRSAGTGTAQPGMSMRAAIDQARKHAKRRMD
jgi:hypothetical protein